MTLCLKIDPGKPDEEKLAEAFRVLREGGVVAFPTETFYGLAADARNETAVEKIFRIKGRNFRNPIALIIADEREVVPLVEEIPAAAKILMQTFWPGPLTLIFRAAPSVSSRLTGGTGKIGIRVSSHPVARLLAAGLAGPLTATSANLSGAPPIESIQSAKTSLPIEKMDPCGFSTPSAANHRLIRFLTSPTVR